MKEQTLERYLTQLASAAPTPGGGAAAAFSAAQAAALLAMVARLSAGTLDSTERESLCTELDQVREACLNLAADDAAAFSAVMAAYKLAKRTDDEKARRAVVLQESLKAAALVPLQLMRCAATLTRPAEILAKAGNPNVLSDVAVAVYLLEAALAAGAVNVRVNLRLIKDKTWGAATEAEVSSLLRDLTLRKPVLIPAGY